MWAEVVRARTLFIVRIQVVAEYSSSPEMGAMDRSRDVAR